MKFFEDRKKDIIILSASIIIFIFVLPHTAFSQTPPAVTLTNVQVSQNSIAAGSSVRITYFWSAASPVDGVVLTARITNGDMIIEDRKNAVEINSAVGSFKVDREFFVPPNIQSGWYDISASLMDNNIPLSSKHLASAVYIGGVAASPLSSVSADSPSPAPSISSQETFTPLTTISPQQLGDLTLTLHEPTGKYFIVLPISFYDYSLKSFEISSNIAQFFINLGAPISHVVNQGALGNGGIVGVQGIRDMSYSHLVTIPNNYNLPALQLFLIGIPNISETNIMPLSQTPPLPANGPLLEPPTLVTPAPSASIPPTAAISLLPTPPVSAPISFPIAKSLPIILTVAGINPIQTLLPGDFSQPFKDPMYLQSSLTSFLTEKNLLNEIEPIQVFFGWQDGDIAGTKNALKNLKKDIQALNTDAKKHGAPFNIVAHSWGTVLAYAALTELANAGEDIRVDNLFTLGSPIGLFSATVLYPANKSRCSPRDGLFDIPGLICPNIPDSVRGKAVKKSRGVDQWINFWSRGDLFSYEINSSDVTNHHYGPTTLPLDPPSFCDFLIPWNVQTCSDFIQKVRYAHAQYYDWDNQDGKNKLTATSILTDIIGKILDKELPVVPYPTPTPINIPTPPNTTCEQNLGIKCPDKRPSLNTTPDFFGSVAPAPKPIIVPSPLSDPIQISNNVFTGNLYQGMKNDRVIALQKLLKERGFFSAGVLITGYFGNITKEAVQKFQTYYGITPSSGYVGPVTRAKLSALLLAH